eukprot:gene9489-12636_t
MPKRLTAQQKQRRKDLADYYKKIGYVYDRDIKWWRPPQRPTPKYTKYLQESQQQANVQKFTKR